MSETAYEDTLAALAADEYQHATCANCYPRQFGPYPVYIGVCGRISSMLPKWRLRDVPKCPDCEELFGKNPCPACLRKQAQ